jgi:superoxide reductase
MKSYICSQCGNIVYKVKDSKVPVFCCGKPMNELTANTVEASVEKHLPVVEVEDNVVRVTVGAVEHPMVEAHYIQWIAIETTKGSQRRKLDYTDKPIAEFKLADGEELVAVYEYCNLHGLWKAE